MKKKFLNWLMHFAYRKLHKLYPDNLFGVPGVREKGDECDMYQPRNKRSFEFNECQGDGHYLCKKCCYLTDDTDS